MGGIEFGVFSLRNLGEGLLAIIELVDPIRQNAVANELKGRELFPAQHQREHPNDDHARSAEHASLQGRSVLGYKEPEVVKGGDADGCEDNGD